MRTTVLFVLVCIGSSFADTAKPHARMGEFLITADSIGETREIEDWGVARAGFHFVRVTSTISNSGKHALCADLSATLETTYSLQSYSRLVKLDDKLTGRIFQLLPGEQVHAEFGFDVRDGVRPLALIVKQLGKRQGCSRQEPLRIITPQVRFPVASIPPGAGK